MITRRRKKRRKKIKKILLSILYFGLVIATFTVATLIFLPSDKQEIKYVSNTNILRIHQAGATSYQYDYDT